MVKYSIGFYHDNRDVVLVTKNRPEWQAGLLNGVGGHIEEGETPHDCVVREFEEEAGLVIPKWDQFLTLVGRDSHITCYAKYEPNPAKLHAATTITDEDIAIYNMSTLNLYPHTQTVPNLKWMIPLMMQRDNYYPPTVSFYEPAPVQKAEPTKCPYEGRHQGNAVFQEGDTCRYCGWTL